MAFLLDLVGGTAILAVGAVVEGDLAVAAVECVASTALASLGIVDLTKKTLELNAGQFREHSIAAVDSGTVAGRAGGQISIDGAIGEAVVRSNAGWGHILGALRATMTVVAVSKGTGDSDGENQNERECLCHFDDCVLNRLKKNG